VLKREGDDEAGPSKKRAKGAKKSLVEMSPDELRSAVANDAIGKFTIPELKEFCQSKGLAVGGKKPDLVERVEQWIEES
jgi:ATP-dependent DNA helicase 2 subunit 1